MKWDFGPANPADPFTRFSCYKWLVARSLSRTIARAAKHASGRLLDVGGGDKRFAPYFASYAEKYISLDHPSTFYGNPRNVDVFGTALELPFADDCFETVASFEVLEHVPDLVRYGSKPDRERARFAAIRSKLRTYEEAVAYAPNQVFTGNLRPEDLWTMERGIRVREVT